MGKSSFFSSFFIVSNILLYLDPKKQYFVDIILAYSLKLQLDVLNQVDSS